MNLHDALSASANRIHQPTNPTRYLTTMCNKTRLKKIILLSTIIVAILACGPDPAMRALDPSGLSPAAAQASYAVKQCDAAYGVGIDGWAANGSGGYQALNSCPGSIQVTGLVNGAYTAAGNWVSWRTPALPAHLSISSASYQSSGSAQTYFGVGGGLCMDGEPLNVYCASDWLFWLPYANTWIDRQNVRPGSRFFKFGMICAHPSGCPRTTWTNGAVRNLSFVMDESVAPTITRTGGTLEIGGWNSGMRTASFAGGDADSGVDRFWSVFDGNPSHPDGANDYRPCARAGAPGAGTYAAFVPCSSFATTTRSFDTRTYLGDGAHSLYMHSIDAAGNAGRVILNFKVDNAEPATPSALEVTSDNEDGWQAVNGFDLTWQDLGETVETATQSGLKQACYDLQPPVGSAAADPVAVCVDETSGSLHGVMVPEDGDWTAAVWTKDRAGNESDRVEVHLRLDVTVPDRPPGRANGWIGLAELINGRDQIWERPGNWQEIESGICGYGFSVTRGSGDEAPLEITVPGDVTEARIPANTPEGISWAHFRAISCSGIAGSITENVEVKVDLTKPVASVAGIPASGWTNAPGTIAVDAVDPMPGSGMDPAAPTDPVEFGASIRLDLDGSFASETPGGSTQLDMGGLADGPHAIDISAFDVARNEHHQSFSYGVDRTAPSGSFLDPDTQDPTVFRALVSDALSGVTGGEIEYAALDRDGSSGAFHALHTSFEAGALVATFPDMQLPRGDYALRAVVNDAAGNQGSVTQRADGRRMVISNPLRASVDLAFGSVQARRVCKRARAKTKRARRKALHKYRVCLNRRRREIAGTGSRVTVPYGHTSVVPGSLTDRRGLPIADQRLDIYEQRSGQPPRLIGGVSTDGGGRFQYRAPSGPSREVIAHWPGTKTEQEASAAIRISVPTKVTLKVRPRVVRGKRRFWFAGKVYAEPGIPAQGKLIQLQFRNLQGRWQAGPALVRARKNGTFRYGYKIRRSGGRREKIVFRAYVPAEASWQYDPGASPARTVVHAP